MNLPPRKAIVPLDRIQEICWIYGLHELWEKIEKDPPTSPFYSDGASCFPDIIGEVDIYPCRVFP